MKKLTITDKYFKQLKEEQDPVLEYIFSLPKNISTVSVYLKKKCLIGSLSNKLLFIKDNKVVEEDGLNINVLHSSKGIVSPYKEGETILLKSESGQKSTIKILKCKNHIYDILSDKKIKDHFSYRTLNVLAFRYEIEFRA